MHTTAARFCKFLRFLRFFFVTDSCTHPISSKLCGFPLGILTCFPYLKTFTFVDRGCPCTVHDLCTCSAGKGTWALNLWIFGITRLNVHSHSKLAVVMYYWGNIFLYSRISRRWGFLYIPDAEIWNGLGAEQEKAKQGCERTPWAIHLEKNKSPSLGATWEQPPVATSGK